MNGII